MNAATCTVCQLAEPRRKLLEKLVHEGSSIETVGQQFRLDYDAVEEHMKAHVRAPQGTTETIEDLLKEHRDVIDAARAMAENEEDAANYAVYDKMVNTYTNLVIKQAEIQQKQAEAQQKADILCDNMTDRVLNPLMLDISRAVVAELARLRAETKQAGAISPIFDQQFAETTRRLGTLITGVMTPHVDTLKNVCAGKSEKKARK